MFQKCDFVTFISRVQWQLGNAALEFVLFSSAYLGFMYWLVKTFCYTY